MLEFFLYFEFFKVSGGADETLRLWRCFAPDPNKKRIQSKGKKTESSVLKGRIR